MANLTGGTYITFNKPYLNMVAESILSNKSLVINKKPQIVNHTPEIKSFLDAVDKTNEKKILSILKIGINFSTIFNGYKWSDIDKSQFTSKGSPSGKTTRMQELASLYSIQKSIENNGYNDQKKFFSLYRKELKDIYPEMNEEWEDTFFQQQLTTYKEVGNTKYNHYSRDGGFMDYITKFVKDKYGISKKDNWNPADIWLVYNLETVKRELKEKILDDVTPLTEFNSVLREYFIDRKIVGISLKKMSGKNAQWELVNLENMDIYDNDEYNFIYDKAEFSLKLKQNGNEFETSDSKLFISGKKGNIKFQIRQNSAGFNNLKIEGTDLGATSARLGKVPLEMAEKYFKQVGLVWNNSNRNFPTTADEFLKNYLQYKKMYITIKHLIRGITEEQFKNNIIAVYNSDRPDFAHSKLMQLHLFSQIFSLKKENLNDLLTTLAYYAQKKGAVFGPFGKLY